MGVEPASDPRGDETGGMESREEKCMAEGFEEVAEGSSAEDPGLKEAEARKSSTACDVMKSDLADGCVQDAEGERSEAGCYQKAVEKSKTSETVQDAGLNGEANLAKGETDAEVMEDQILNLEENPVDDVVGCGDQQHQVCVRDATVLETEALFGDEKDDVDSQDGRVPVVEELKESEPERVLSFHEKLEVDLAETGSRLGGIGGIEHVESGITTKVLEEVSQGSSAEEESLVDRAAQEEGGAEIMPTIASEGIGKEDSKGMQKSNGDQGKIEGICIGNEALNEAQFSDEDKPSTYNDTMRADLNAKNSQAVEGKMSFRSEGERTELTSDQKTVRKAENIGTVADIITVISVETVGDDGFDVKANLATGGSDALTVGCRLGKAGAVFSLVLAEGENIEKVASIELVKGRNAAEVLEEVARGPSGKEPSLYDGHGQIDIGEQGTSEGVAETASMVASEGIGTECNKIMQKLDVNQNEYARVCADRGFLEEAESVNEEFVEAKTCFTGKREINEFGGDEKAESFGTVVDLSHIVAVETVEDSVLEGKEYLAEGETGLADISLGSEAMEDRFPDLKGEIPENDLVGCGLIDQHLQEDTPDARHKETALVGDEQKHDVKAQDLHDGYLQATERLQDRDPRKESGDNEKLDVNVVDTGNGLGSAKAVVCPSMEGGEALVGKAEGNFILDAQSDFLENKDVKLVDENSDDKEGIIVADSCFLLQEEMSSVIPQEKDCIDYITGQNQEIENPLADQNFGTSPYQIDSNITMSDQPPTIEGQNVELSVQQLEADQKNPVLGGDVAIAVMHADTSDYQKVQVEDQSFESKSMEYVAIRSGTSAMDNDHYASYYLPFLDKETFAVSDLVWGKVKSHPWWPGQIFDPSDASDMALKHQKKDNHLVAYFGDKTFAWCDETQLKPFETNFSHMENQSTSDLFVDSVNSVLGEVSRRVELGMSCSCLPGELHVNNIYENFENAGIREEVSNCQVDRSQILNYFHPDRLLEYIRNLAWLPTLGTDGLELVIAKAQLKAFYKLKGHPELPIFQIGATIGNDPEALSRGSDKLDVDSSNYSAPTPVDINPGKPKSRGRGRPRKKQNHILEDTLEEMSFSESIEEKSAFNHANVGENNDEITVDELTVFSGKKRKFIDFDSADSGKVADERLDLLEDFDTKLPSPTFGSSFKVGECIRRVASRLTGFPPTRKFHGETNQNSVSKSENMIFDDLIADISSPTDLEKRKRKVVILKNYSSDEMLSQLCLAARDPMKGYSFLSIIISFFTDFRNFSNSSSAEETNHGEKVAAKRGRKRKVDTQPSPSEMSADDHMQDSYWSDLIPKSGPITGLKRREEAHTRWHRKKRRSSGEASISPFSDSTMQRRQVGTTSNTKQTMTTGRSVINVEEKMVDEGTPTALLLSFNGSNFLPSETELIRIFSRFGPLKEAETEVQRKTNSAKVVFKRRSDAERAFSSAGKYSIFGPSLLSYRLRHLPSQSDIHPSIIQQEKDIETPNGVGSSEVPGQPSDIHSSIIQQEKDIETPDVVGSSEVPGQPSDIHPSMTQQDKVSETLNGVGNSDVPGQPSDIHPSMMQHGEVSETPNGVGNSEAPDQPSDIHPSMMQQGEVSETPNGVGNLEVPGEPSDIHPSVTQQVDDCETPNGVGSLEVSGQLSDIHPSIMQLDKDSETPDEFGILDVPVKPFDIHPSMIQQATDSETPNVVGSLEVPGQPSDIHPRIIQQDEDNEAPNGAESLEVPGQPSVIHPCMMQQDEDSETPNGVGSLEVPGQPSGFHPSITPQEKVSEAANGVGSSVHPSVIQDETREAPNGVGSLKEPDQPSDIHLSMMQQDEDSGTPNGVGSLEASDQPSDIQPSMMRQDEESETPNGVGSSEVSGQLSDIHSTMMQQDEDSETPNGVGSLEVPGQPSDIQPTMMRQDEESETPNGVGSSEVPGEPSDIHPTMMQQDEDSETPNGVGSLEVPGQPSNINPNMMQQDEDGDTPNGVGSLDVPDQLSDIRPSITQQGNDIETPDGVGSLEVLGKPSDLHPSFIQQNRDSETPNGVGSLEVPAPEVNRLLSDTIQNEAAEEGSIEMVIETVQNEAAEEGSVEMVIETSEQPHDLSSNC